MATSSDERWYRTFVAGAICMILAATFAILIAWAGHVIVVQCLGQEEITFWVAIAIAILVWFIEEMLHLTLPCRRALRRLANQLAQLWLAHRDRAVHQSRE